MTDLIEKLKAAIAEDERIALATGSTEWEAHVYLGDGSVREAANDCLIAAHREVYPECAISMDGDDARHIARHDPARVLREVAAKRKILELHVRVILRAGGGADYYKTTNVCRSCEPRRGALVGEHSWPCPTLLAIAEPYGITEEA